MDELVYMARQAHQESKYRHLLFSESKVRQIFQNHSQPQCLGIIARNDRHISGFFLAEMSGMVFTEQPIAMETTYWIRPEHRGGRAFLLLMTEFNKWAEKYRLPQFCIPHFAEDNTKTYSALEKFGFIEAGRIYSRGI